LFGSCERNWVAKTEVTSNPTDFENSLNGPFGLYAVARVAAPTRPLAEGGNPPGTYVVVFARPNGEGTALTVDPLGVVKINSGCSQDASQLLAALGESNEIGGIVLAPTS
jgi:hypothetical protein